MLALRGDTQQWGRSFPDHQAPLRQNKNVWLWIKRDACSAVQLIKQLVNAGNMYGLITYSLIKLHPLMDLFLFRSDN